MDPSQSEFLAYLRDQEVLSSAQVVELQKAGGAGSRTLRQSLLESKLLDEASFLAHWAQMKGVAVLTAADLVPDAHAFEKVAPDYCLSHSVLPLRVEEGALVVAMSDPTDTLTIEDLRFLTNMGVEPRPASTADLASALASAGAVPFPEPADDSEEESPVVREVCRILEEALDSGASHVHLEPGQTGMVVLHRIEGTLKEIRRIPAVLQAGLTARLKILGELDIAERRIPQNGLIRLTAPRPAEVAISTLPTAFHRERITLRFAGPRAPVRPPAELGFARDVAPFFERVARARDGLFVISGPAVSGRTTTLYSLASALASAGRSVLAVEENPLFPLPGVTQIRPNSPASFPTSMAARHAMFHDADVLVVDPLGDAEALASLLKAVVRRHLVLASMHAPTPGEALRRLRGMSDDGYTLAHAVRAILGQRLVRALCPACRRPDPASREAAARHGLATGSLFQPVGCKACFGIGFRGHLPAGWVLEITEDHRRWIERGGFDEEPRPPGKDPLRQAILGLAASGATSLAEALVAADA